MKCHLCQCEWVIRFGFFHRRFEGGRQVQRYRCGPMSRRKAPVPDGQTTPPNVPSLRLQTETVLRSPEVRGVLHANRCKITRDVVLEVSGVRREILLGIRRREDDGHRHAGAIGERGVPAEQVAASCADEVSAYLAAEVPVGEHLADQLLLPLALGKGGRFVTTRPSLHTLTQVDTLRAFLPVEISIEQQAPLSHLVTVRT